MSTRLLLIALPAVFLIGCRQDMHDQPKYRTYAYSEFWNDARSARPRVENTIARGQLHTDAKMFKGKDGDAFTNTIPYTVDKAFLARGQNRYNIYCSPCHGQTGDGEGMVVQRGFKHPPTYHQDRLRNQPAGYYYDVITNGFGSMISYASRVQPQDRWAIVAYVRALQLSQNATVEDVPAADRPKLDQAPAAPSTHQASGGGEHPDRQPSPREDHSNRKQEVKH